MKQLIIASTSSLHNQSYLEYLKPTLAQHFRACKQLVFIPYARPGGITLDAYTLKTKEFFKQINLPVVGIHEFNQPQEAIETAEGIFTGGGNTFVLVKTLHDLKLMEPLRTALLNGTPYLGSSAGSNICGINMKTTNDMPIVYPSSFKTLGLIPFNVNPHYLDPLPNSTHMGETRETRIQEFHAHNNLPVVGLREGSWLEVKGSAIALKGDQSARIFKPHTPPFEAAADFDFSKLG